MPRISLLVNVQPRWRASLMPWLDLQEGRIAILTAFGHAISGLDLPHPVFTDADVVPLGSGIEERIHRDVDLHRQSLVKRLEAYRSQGVSYANDLAV